MRSPFLRIGQLITFFLLCCLCCNASNPLIVENIDGWECLENYTTYFTSSENWNVSKVLNLGKFRPYDETTFQENMEAIWMKFTLASKNQPGDSLHINTKFYDEIRLYEIREDSVTNLIVSTGYLPQFQDQSVEYYNNTTSFYHPRNTRKEYLLGLISHTRNSRMLSNYFTSNCAKIYAGMSYKDQYNISKYLLFFFFGGILMMSFYNLGVAITTHYKEYILFSIYNFSFVLLGISISNLHVELGWIQPFSFDRNLRFLPLLLAIPVYVLFAIHFLNIKELNIKFYRFLKLLLWVFPFLAVALLLSFFSLVFVLFTALMLPLFLTLLYTSVIRAKQHVYARYFLVGNLLLISVGIGQLFSLFGFMSISGVAVLSIAALTLEIIFFSFAVAIKLKVTRKELFIARTRNQLQREQLVYELSLKEKLQQEVDQKSRALTSSSIQWLHLSEQLSELKEMVKSELKEKDRSLYKEIVKRIKHIEDFESHWNSFRVHFENVHNGFFERIESNFPMLSQNDLRICAFMKMKLSNKEIAQILNVTKKAVEQSKRRMRKKVGLETDQNLLEVMEKPFSDRPKNGFPIKRKVNEREIF